MSFLKSKGFKYIKNLAIGLAAAVVLMGALFKIESWEGASEMLIIGLTTEAVIFVAIGLLGPDPDYYWDKLYPGLADYSAPIQSITPQNAGANIASPQLPALNGEVVESKLSGMLAELQTMSRSMSSLKALQEVDFSGTQDQIKSMSNFYSKMTEAMANMSDAVEDTKLYKEQMSALNKNLSSLNSVYGGMLSAMSNLGGR